MATASEGSCIDPSPPGPFAAAAEEMAARGLAPLPLGGDAGKTPLVKNWTRWRYPPGPDFLRKMVEQHGAANVGVLCGLSRVTVVDIDDPGITDALIDRCGDTPLKVCTPSGGLHLYYRSAGERNANLRREGLAADVRGIGGMVVTPPSMRPSTGAAYRFLEGTWGDLDRLPCVKAGALDVPAANPSRTSASARPARNSTPARVSVGQRNDTLFRSMLREVKACQSLADTLEKGHALNSSFEEPLPEAEVARTVESVWRIEAEGHNWVGREPHVSLPSSALDVFAGNGEALMLFMRLKASHDARGGPFAVSPKAMARAGVIVGWPSRRYSSARDWLLSKSLLIRIHQGGRGAGDPHLYVFGPAAK